MGSVVGKQHISHSVRNIDFFIPGVNGKSPGRNHHRLGPPNDGFGCDVSIVTITPDANEPILNVALISTLTRYCCDELPPLGIHLNLLRSAPETGVRTCDNSLGSDVAAIVSIEDEKAERIPVGNHKHIVLAVHGDSIGIP